MTAPVKKTPPRDNLCRSVPFTLIRTGEAEGDNGLTFSGYGAVFNEKTRINSQVEGCFDEMIALGATRKSVRERVPKFQFDHGHHPMFGSLPLGTISSIHEDERGLFVEADVLSTWFWEPVREAISRGAVDGMSIRFSVVKEEWRDAAGEPVNPDDVEMILYGRDTNERGPLLRTLKEIKVAEVGPVVWPAYSTTTASIRSIDWDRMYEPEQRKLLAEAVLRIDTADSAPEEGRSSDDEPQDTAAEVAVEHSDEDTDTPRSTAQAGEHESDSTTEIPSEEDQLFVDALAEVRRVRESTPPMTGVR